MKEKLMVRSIKKLISYLGIILMFISIIPISSLNVYAGDSCCKIGNQEYETIEDALKHGTDSTQNVPIDENENNPTIITLISNCSEEITIPSGRCVTLDLNGYLLSNNLSIIDNHGNLTIKDSNTNNQIHKFSLYKDKNMEMWKLDESNGTEYISGGCITGCGFEAIENCENAQLTIAGGNIVGNYSDEYAAITNEGELTFNAGQIIGNYGETEGAAINNSGNLNICGTAKIIENYGSYAIGNDGEITVGGMAKIIRNHVYMGNLLTPGPINIATDENAPKEGMEIGVTLVGEDPESGEMINFDGSFTYNALADYEKYFISDSEEFYVKYIEATTNPETSAHLELL